MCWTSVDVVGGFVSGTGRGTGLAIGGGGGGGNMGVGRNGLCTLPWLLPLGCRDGNKTKHARPSGRNRGLPLRRRRGQGPHLAKRWEPRGFS